MADSPSALEYWTFGIAASAFVVSVGALIYTHLQLSLARRVRREQNEPHVVVDIAPPSEGSSLLMLTIQNIGTTVARDVRVQVDPPLRSVRGGQTREQALAAALARTIPYLPPRKRLNYWVDVAFEAFAEGSTVPRSYTFIVDATGPFGPVEQATYIVDLNAMAENTLNHDTVVGRLGQIAERLKS